MHGRRRGLDPVDDGEGPSQLPESKRQKTPALASVIVEALKVDSLQKLSSSLEPILRRVVSEEVERALAKLGSNLGTARIVGRPSPKRIEGPDGRNLRLQFKTRLSQPIFTGGKVDGEQGAAIHVVLLDANTDAVLTSGPESYAKLDVVVLEGDFNDEDDENWTEEEFESHVVKEREGKRPLLTGDLQVTLKEGVGTLGDITFTDNSSWIRSRKFRLGVKITSGFCEGVRVREAKTEAFTVKDHRGELYKKHYPPSWNDEVWRLEKIGKDGSFHKKLTQNGIQTVEDFLRLYVRDPQRLRHILGSGMSNKMWDALIEHAKTCPLSGAYYVFYSDGTRNCGAIFNNRYEFSGLISGNQFVSVESLTESQMVIADSLVKRAYDNWGNVIEYNGKALLNFKQSKKTMSTRADSRAALSNYPSVYEDQVPRQHLPASAPVEQPVIGAEVIGGGSDGYSGNQANRYSSHPQLVSSDVSVDYGSTSYVPTHQFEESNLNEVPRNTNTGLALALPQESSLGFQPLGQSLDSADHTSYYNWPRQRDNQGDEYLTEEEIRIRSHEILENDEMQQLLRHLGMAGTSNGLPEDGLGFQSYMSPFPNFNFDEEQGRSSGKAVVGWLKIKAAMRWGIFIRKKAAERRKAQLVELED